MTLIDGKLVSATLRKELKGKVAKIKEEYGKTIRLSVVIVGHDPASEIYVNNKQKACFAVGIESDTIRLDENVDNETLRSEILKLAEDDSVDGILLQLPLPKHLDEKAALALIPTEKDVDGFSSENVGKLTLFSKDALRSCTPSGMISLLDYYGIELRGKHAVVVGRSDIVGKPMALMLLQRDCTVTVCHSKTQNLSEITSQADILVCAVGKKHLITADMVKQGAVVLDAGINRENGKIYGDCDFENVSKKASYITPVPGGVGPMTITSLLMNVYEAGVRKING